MNAWRLLDAGNALYREGKVAEAAACYREAAAQDPTCPESSYNLGCALLRLTGPGEALSPFQRAVSLRPEWGDARFNLGCALAQTGRLEEALRHLQEAARLKPLDAAVRNNLGLTLSILGRANESEAAFFEALRLDPLYAQAHNNLAILYEHHGRIGAAITSCEKALALRPHYPEALGNLACALKAQGRTEEAIARYRQALALDPGLTEAHSSLLFTLGYSARLGGAEILSEHRAFGERHLRPLPLHANDPDPQRTLRIGYLSADFKDHAVSRFLAPVLKSHDRSRFEIFCYANVATPDRGTGRLRGLADRWREIYGMADEAAARTIGEDGIDILVDLSGHTAGNRLTLCALKPAPVQVTWIGYPQTTGLAAMDYRITDAVCDPPGRTEAFHTEELLRLPGTFSCFEPPADAPEVGELPALESGTLTFGSFNNPAKLTPETVALWCGVLRALPTSRMLVKGYSLADPGTRQRLAALFAENGVSPERLLLQGNTVSYGDHLLLYHSVDIALDSYPYHGTTTTCEALWMGVPVVTLAGDEHRSRVGATILGAVGLPELVADSPEGFAARALDLAGDLVRLRRLRAGLRQRMAASPLTDAASFTTALEDAYRQIWGRWCSARTGGNPPAGGQAGRAATGVGGIAKALESLAAGSLDRALQGFLAVLGDDPASGEALSGIEKVLNRLTALEMAQACRRDAGLLPQGEPGAVAGGTLLDCAQILLQRGFLTPAYLICHHLLDRNEKSAPLYRILGEVAREIGEAGSAAHHYQEAVRLGDVGTATAIALVKARHAALCREEGGPKERFLLVKAWGYGFWSDMAHLLGGLLLAEITGRTPVVHWGGKSLFSDDPGRNAFHDFFLPVGSVTVEDLSRAPYSCYPPKWQATTLAEEGVNCWEGSFSRFSALRALERTEDVVVSDFHFSVHDLVPWIRPGHWLYGRETDEVCRALFTRYLTVRPEIAAQAEHFYRQRMAGKEILAVHLRGGDKGGEDPNLELLNSLYPARIERFLSDYPQGNLFLFTDDQRLLDRYRGSYGERVIHTEVARTADARGVHYQQGSSRQRLGVEVIVDVLLALHCQAFLGNGLSNVSCAVAQLKKWQPGTVTLLGARLDRLRQVTLYRS